MQAWAHDMSCTCPCPICIPVDYPGRRQTETRLAKQAVFERIARLNHCCRPNAEHAWDAASGTQCVRALRRIALGEQIFLSYIGDESRVLQLPREKRQSMLLDAFGFTCVCSRCERGDVEDDRQHDMLNAALQREAASNALW